MKRDRADSRGFLFRPRMAPCRFRWSPLPPVVSQAEAQRDASAKPTQPLANAAERRIALRFSAAFPAASLAPLRLAPGADAATLRFAASTCRSIANRTGKQLAPVRPLLFCRRACPPQAPDKLQQTKPLECFVKSRCRAYRGDRLQLGAPPPCKDGFPTTPATRGTPEFPVPFLHMAAKTFRPAIRLGSYFLLLKA